MKWFAEVFITLALKEVLSLRLGQTTLQELLDQSYDRALAGLTGDLQSSAR